MQFHDDSKYLALVRRGNVSAFAVIVDRYKDFAFTIACRIVKNHEDAEEVTQDAFVKAYQSLQSFQERSKFSTWLYSIVYRTALDMVKKKNPGTKELSQHTENTQIRNDGNTGLKILKQKDQQNYLKKAMEKLEPEEGAIISLYYLEERSIREICQITGLSESNAKVRLFRARKKLSVELSQLLRGEEKSIL